MPSPTYTYRAQLGRVTDGDTCWLVVDVGFRMTATVPIRLVGINSPEMSTAAGVDAKAWAAAWFARHPNLIVETAKDPEKFGRWLGVISADNEVLNDALVASGHAVRWSGVGKRPV